MPHITMICLVVLCASSLCAIAEQQHVKPLPTIEVNAPVDVAKVNAVNDALGALSEKVTACAEAGQDPKVCQCRYPQELLKLRRTYASLMEQHPDWKDKLLSYRRASKEGRSISGTLVLENLRRQLEMLKCK